MKKEMTTGSVYLTAGFPNLVETKNKIKELETQGEQVIELGIPFSDPIADEPEVQAAFVKAICGGVTLEKVFEMLEELQSEGLKLSIVFRMYYNNVLFYGVERFVKRCEEVGVKGLYILDLPTVERGEIAGYMKDTNLCFVSAKGLQKQ